MNDVIELEEPAAQEPVPAKRPPITREAFKTKCLEQIGALQREANEAQLNSAFVWAATWHLAMVMHACGPRAVADVFSQIGAHFHDLLDRQEVQREAEEVKAQGRLPQ